MMSTIGINGHYLKATAATTETPKTGLAASRFANIKEDDEAAAVGGTGPAAEGEPDHSSAALALVRKPLATCSLPYQVDRHGDTNQCYYVAR